MGFIKQFFQSLKESVTAGGPSSTKLIYTATGCVGLFCAFVISLTFCGVYIVTRVADPAFAGSVSAMWLVVYGFVTGAQNKKASADRDIEVSRSAGRG